MSRKPYALRQDKLTGSIFASVLVVLLMLGASVANGQTAHPYIKPSLGSPNAEISPKVETPAFSEPTDTLILEFPEKTEFPTQATAPIQETPATVQLLPIPMPYTSRPFDPRVQSEPKIFTFEPKKFNRTYWIPFGLAVGSSFADWFTTAAGIARGGQEANPVFGYNNGRSVRYGANVAATAAFLSYTAWLEHKGHRRIARILLYTLASLRFTAAVHNHNVRR